MNSMMAGRLASADTTATPADRRSEEAEIALFLARTDPVDVLATAGYLSGHDGNLIVRELREPQLRRALDRSVCYAVAPDPDSFYQEDDETPAHWRRRRAATIRDHCAVCPVRAVCAELALRDEDTEGIRGGLPEEKLALRLKTEHERLVAARAEDTRAATAQDERVQAGAEVLQLAQQYLGGSVPADTRAKNKAAINKAVQVRDALNRTRRAAAGWMEAA